jgi:hypothetical protein
MTVEAGMDNMSIHLGVPPAADARPGSGIPLKGLAEAAA